VVREVGEPGDTAQGPAEQGDCGAAGNPYTSPPPPPPPPPPAAGSHATAAEPARRRWVCTAGGPSRAAGGDPVQIGEAADGFSGGAPHGHNWTGPSKSQFWNGRRWPVVRSLLLTQSPRATADWLSNTSDRRCHECSKTVTGPGRLVRRNHLLQMRSGPTVINSRSPGRQVSADRSGPRSGAARNCCGSPPSVAVPACCSRRVARTKGPARTRSLATIVRKPGPPNERLLRLLFRLRSFQRRNANRWPDRSCSFALFVFGCVGAFSRSGGRLLWVLREPCGASLNNV